MCSTEYETVWTFSTARFEINLAIAEETMDYRGNCSAIDEEADRETEEFCSEGGWHWCRARVQVIFVDHDNPQHWADTRRVVLGEDYLGGCSYHGLEDFKTGGYFRDMVGVAVDEARGALARMTLSGVEA